MSGFLNDPDLAPDHGIQVPGVADVASLFPAVGERIEIFNEGRYRAFVQDLECMWRWEILRDEEVVQEGCSLSERSSREAVGYVVAYFRRCDASPAPAEDPLDGRA